MKIKKYWMMIAIALVSFCTVGCGGDDNEEEFSTGKDNNTTNTTTESTTHLATAQVKTVTLKPISNKDLISDVVCSGEYLVYKDYYYKYTLCLNGTRIYMNAYTSGGSGWGHYVSGLYGYDISGIYDVGDVADITQIEKRELYYNYNLRSLNLESYTHNSQFKPGHGYGVGFLTGADKEIQQMRVFPTKYTLDSNDVLTSVTIEYQLF